MAEKLLQHDKRFSYIYQALDYLINKDKAETKDKQREKIGFKI